MTNQDKLQLLLSINKKHFNSENFSKRKDYAFYSRIDRILEIEHYKDKLKLAYQKQLKELNDWQNSLIESGIKDARVLGWLDD